VISKYFLYIIDDRRKYAINLKINALALLITLKRILKLI